MGGRSDPSRNARSSSGPHGARPSRVSAWSRSVRWARCGVEEGAALASGPYPRATTRGDTKPHQAAAVDDPLDASGPVGRTAGACPGKSRGARAGRGGPARGHAAAGGVQPKTSRRRSGPGESTRRIIGLRARWRIVDRRGSLTTLVAAPSRTGEHDKRASKTWSRCWAPASPSGWRWRPSAADRPGAGCGSSYVRAGGRRRVLLLRVRPPADPPLRVPARKVTAQELRQAEAEVRRLDSATPGPTTRRCCARRGDGRAVEAGRKALERTRSTWRRGTSWARRSWARDSSRKRPSMLERWSRGPYP